LFLPSGIIFKGSGFYSTDYKSSSNKTISSSTSAKEDKKESKKEDRLAVPDAKTSSTSSNEKVKT
jgi:hypothetical protein